MRRGVALGVALVSVLAAGGVALAAPVPVAPVPTSSLSASSLSAQAAPGAYRPPVTGGLRVLRPFEPPPTPYAAGHRGVDLAADGGTVVAAGAGTVSFAGVVAGRGVVVIAHPDGISTEYEPLTVVVTRGRAVAAGTVIGHVRGRHGRFAPGQVLHWGARRDGRYLNPLSLLRGLGPVRLLPWASAPFGSVRRLGPRRDVGSGALRTTGQARGWACRKLVRRRSIETCV